jgi:hypothetical protein
MLQEVQGITQSAAAGIAAEYPSFAALMRAFEKAERKGTAEALLADCEVSLDPDDLTSGAQSQERYGQRPKGEQGEVAFRSR